MTDKSHRLLSLDLLRGLIMAIMALDHVNLFVVKAHYFEFWGIPLTEYSSLLPFFTRYIAHFCAPGFFFLMGAGIILFSASRSKKGWTYARQTRFLALRGLILIVFQFVLENPGFVFGQASGPVTKSQLPGSGTGELCFGVLYGLGASMLLWSLLIRLKGVYVLVISLTTIVFTQLFTPPNESAAMLYPQIARVLFIPGRTGIVHVLYPLIPWFGVCGLGIFFGKVLLKNPSKTFKYAFLFGITFLILFVTFRFIGFGDFHPPKDGFTGFMSVTKYPPSAAFLLITLGVNLILLHIFYRFEKFLRNKWNPLLVFGRTALFFYIIHIYLYAVMGYLFPNGTNYGIMYIFWILGLILLYPMCLWYGNLKQKKSPDSIWRFF